MVEAKPLKLLAQDAEDLSVLSAAVQDAVLKVGDITFEPGARRLTVALNRYRWEVGGGERIRAGLQLGGVLKVQTRRVKRDAPEAVLELLAVTFEPGEAPGGVVRFSFAGDADLQATVECVDGVMADVSQPWTAKAKPSHEV